MKHDWTADLLTYWDRLRGTRAAPDRRDISPRALGGKLPNIFILRSDTEISGATEQPETADIPQAKQWQFRLAGTRLCTIYGRELRNTRFLSLWHDDVRSWLAEQLHLSGLDYRPLRLEHTGQTLNEKTAISKHYYCRCMRQTVPLHGSAAWLHWISRSGSAVNRSSVTAWVSRTIILRYLFRMTI
ncbi:PAS domain-containing protein [Pseudochrobactrum algeriensis]|uniref:PAS domain-containing protein n=1 Tax=Pseudochrobactrum algeriensis TaxID=2834768 RepID=UPI001BCBE552|nr:PAS domain-containing protein [Pseudochrobactrum algeriensis]QVQ35768.1 PAS domain-containing protein [Pseudochrobactrum algeriensis]